MRNLPHPTPFTLHNQASNPFTAEPFDAGQTYEVCFYGTKDGAIGLERQTRVRCITISIPTTYPIYLAGMWVRPRALI